MDESPRATEISSLDKSLKPERNYSIDDIVFDLLKAHPNLKAGTEPLPSLKDSIATLPDANAGETDAEAAIRVSALIGKQTDYECRIHNNWLIVVPRPDKQGRFNLPGALRMCASPTVKGLQLSKFLRMVKGVRPEEPLTLGRFTFGHEPQFPIDSKERTVPCFQLLSDIADQLSLRCWRMSHISGENSSGKIEFPLDLDFAYVEFHRPGEIRSSRGK